MFSIIVGAMLLLHNQIFTLRSTLSVDYEGRLYDCDFNQQLGMQLENETGYNIYEKSFKLLGY